MAKKEIIETNPRPNIKLREGASPATVEGLAYPVGAEPIMLPDLKNQKAGWYHPRAEEIIRHYPHLYLPYVEKGDN